MLKRIDAFRLREHGLLEIAIDGKGDVSGTHVTVLERRSIAEVPTPVVSGNRVFMVKNGGILTSIDRTEQERLYQIRVGATGSFFASPLLAGDRLFLMAVSGKAVVLDVSGDRAEVLAKNDLADEIFATPAIVDGTMYVRTKGHLYAFRR